jgi:putative DNA primase/helicase
MSAPIEQFRDAIQSAGLIPPDVIEADGKLRRFPSNGKQGDDAGWYVLHDGGIPAGTFGDWRNGLSQSWRADIGRKLTAGEIAAHKANMEAIRRQREEDQALRHTEAASRAKAILEAATPAPTDHAYLVKKAIPASGARVHDGRLVIPMRADGDLQSLQFIGADGEKRFLTGGRVTGCYFSIGKPTETLCIAEGFATGASIHEATGHAVAVAFDAGNLPAVAKAMRAKFPDLKIIICGDFDKSGTGQKAATEAAQAIGALVTIPQFTAEELAADKAPSDWNDYAGLRGAEAVKQAIAGASTPAKAEHQADKGNAQAEPELLRAPLPPGEPYPVAALGAVLGNAALAIHEVVKAPLAMCCQSVLAAASLAAQAHYDIKLPWGERKPLSLFLLTVGESGERKSGVDDLVLGAAKAQEREDMATYAEAQKDYEAALSAWNQATEAARKAVTGGKKNVTAQEIRNAVDQCGEKPTAPIAPLRFVTDPTVEGLYKLLVVGQPSVALFSDEGGLLIGGHALNSDNALKTMARWCKLWDGSPFDRVRAGDGAGILYGRRMALHQLAQPDVMTTLLSDRMANGQGFLARCLVAWPESTISTRMIDGFEWAGDRHEVKRLFAVLKQLLEVEPRTDGSIQELDPVELSLSDDAKALAVLAQNQFEALMAKGADLAELRDRTSKALENACRIAGVLTVIDKGLTARVIESEALERALILVQWYLAEALRIRGAAAIPQSVSDAELLSKWLQERGLRLFRSRQVLTSGPSQLRNKQRLLAAIKEMVTCGYLAENDPGTVIDGVSARTSWEVIHYVV